MVLKEIVPSAYKYNTFNVNIQVSEKELQVIEAALCKFKQDLEPYNQQRPKMMDEFFRPIKKLTGGVNNAVRDIESFRQNWLKENNEQDFLKNRQKLIDEEKAKDVEE